MRIISKILILNIFMVSFVLSSVAEAQSKRPWWKFWSEQEKTQDFIPYLENSRHVQIPQWAHETWYAEDWTSQAEGLSLIKGFYKANILKDQVVDKGSAPVLVVGPNFYRLSGYDKRRVAHVVDVVYGVTDRGENNFFMLKDWHSRHYIGVFDENGLRLH